MTPLLLVVAFAIGLFLFFAGLDGARKAGRAADNSLPTPAPQAVAPPALASFSLRDRMDQLWDRGDAQQPLASRSDKPPRLSLAEQLSRADLKLRTSEWMMIRFGSAALLALIGLIRFGFGAQFLILAVAGYFLPRFYLGHRQARRLKAFNDQLGDTLVLMANALRTGYSLAQTVDVVANKSSPPIGQEFDRIVKEMHLGAHLEDSLARMVRRTESKDLDLVVTAMAINRKIGGNLSEILDSIAETIRERVRINGELKTLTAQARASGYLITALPIILGIFMYFVTPAYFAPMLGSAIGIGMLVVAGIFMGLGQLIMGKLASVDV